MRAQATEQDIAQVCDRIQSLGFRAHVMPGAERTAVGITGNHGPVPAEEFESLAGVAEAIPVSKPYKLVSREVKPDNTVVEVAGVLVGGDELAICAGPCSVESREQILEAARAVKAAGAQLLRGGAYKPRTSPYAFQGLGEEGLRYLAEAREETGLGIVTEAIDVETFDLVEEYADCLQIGARNMQNFSLLRRAGPRAQAGAAEARHVVDAGRIPDGRRIHSVGRQLSGDPVRARRPDLCRSHPQHAGPERGSGGAAPEPSADHRRPAATAPASATRFIPWRWPRWPRALPG